MSKGPISENAEQPPRPTDQELQEKLLRSLAESENARVRYQREVSDITSYNFP